jgi:hypothetical protein
VLASKTTLDEKTTFGNRAVNFVVPAIGFARLSDL